MLHMQGGIPGWLSVVEKLPDGAMVKSVMDGGSLVEVKGINPKLTTVYRHWLPHHEQVYGQDLDQAISIANGFFSKFVDGTFFSKYAPYVDAIETHNETLAWNTPEPERSLRIQQERAFAIVWRQWKQVYPELDGIKLIHANIAVGNDVPTEIAQLAVEFGNWVGYHPYSYYHEGQRDSGDWVYYSGRWNTNENMWGSVKPTWAFTECGPFYNVHEGWRHPLVLNGNREAYVEAVRAWIRDVQGTAAYYEGRLKGFALFTTGPSHVGWDYYQTHFPELDMLADMVNQEWKPGSGTVPDPDPPPSTEHEGIDVSYWQYGVDWKKAESAGAKFAFIRSTMGSSGKDGYWDANRDAILNTSILPGCYHLYRDDRNAVQQAEWFAQHIPDGFVPAVDMEMPAYEGVQNRVLTFLQKLEELIGVKPVIYTAAWWWNPNIGNVSWASSYPLWVANYTTASEPIMPLGWNVWDIWQYSNSGNGYNYGTSSARVDLNRFRGDLRAWWSARAKGGVVTPPDPTPPSGYRVTANVLNVRLGPGTNNRDMGDLYYGEIVKAAGDPEGDWVPIRLWAHKDWLDEV